jgi:hypothetical protein
VRVALEKVARDRSAMLTMYIADGRILVCLNFDDDADALMALLEGYNGQLEYCTSAK